MIIIVVLQKFIRPKCGVFAGTSRPTQCGSSNLRIAIWSADERSIVPSPSSTTVGFTVAWRRPPRRFLGRSVRGATRLFSLHPSC